jgi:hypothetical protein
VEELQCLHKNLHEITTARFPGESDAFLFAPASDADVQMVHNVYDLMRDNKLADILAMCDDNTEFIACGSSSFEHHGVFKGPAAIQQHLTLQSQEQTLRECCPQVKDVKKVNDGSVLVLGTSDGNLKSGERL